MKQNKDVDYYDEEGMLCCHVCGRRKEYRWKLFGTERIVPCKCECEMKKLESEKKLDEKREAQRRIEQERENGIYDGNLRKATFDSVEMTPEAKICKMYAENWENEKRKNHGLLMYGGVGCGKTTLAACIANSVLNQKGTVYMTSFPKILNAGIDKTEISERIRHADLVVFDDLGAERNSEYAKEIVYYIVDERYRTGKPLIVTTNLMLQELKNPSNKEYERIYDRILEMCVPFQFSGKSERPKIAEANRVEVSKEYTQRRLNPNGDIE